MASVRRVPAILAPIARKELDFPITDSESLALVAKLEQSLTTPATVMDQEIADDSMMILCTYSSGVLSSGLVSMSIQRRLIEDLMQLFAKVEDLSDFESFALFWDTVCSGVAPGEIHDHLQTVLRGAEERGVAAQRAVRLGLDRLERPASES